MVRPFSLLAVLLLLAPTCAYAQTVRFFTTAGDFDMQLNPTNNSDLQAHVDNLVAYIGSGRYHAGVINRAPDDFVLQLGGFTGRDVSIDTVPLGGFDSIDSFNDVVVDANNDGQVDFDTTGLTNTRGTVSLALAAGDANSGGSSFFVNIGDNSFLDSQSFVPFATIDNMATINRIMGLEKADISSQVGQSGSLAYTDVPLTEDGELVIIENVMVVSDSNFAFEGPIRFAAGLPEISASEALGLNDVELPASAFSETAAAPSAATSVTPEPTSLAILSAVALTLLGRRRRN